MPIRNLGHHDRPSPGVCELGHGHHPPDCLPKRLSKAPDTLEAREVPRSPPHGASPPSPSSGGNARFVSPKQERFRLREVSRPLARSKNQRKCGRVRIKADVEVSRRVDQEEGGAHFHGLVRCGSGVGAWLTSVASK